MSEIFLIGILFCFIVCLCIVSGYIGFIFGVKENRKPKYENVVTDLSEEDEINAIKRQRQEENFWNYDGNRQELI